MGLIDKAAILAAQDIQTKDVEMPEWGGSVRVRELSATDILGFWDACRDAEGDVVRERVQPALLVRAIVGADGTALFSDADISGLMAKSAAAVTRLFIAAKKLNGIGQEEAIAKNSDAAPSGASPSASA
jgi:hypothetical protein